MRRGAISLRSRRALLRALQRLTRLVALRRPRRQDRLRPLARLTVLARSAFRPLRRVAQLPCTLRDRRLQRLPPALTREADEPEDAAPVLDLAAHLRLGRLELRLRQLALRLRLGGRPLRGLALSAQPRRLAAQLRSRRPIDRLVLRLAADRAAAQGLAPPDRLLIPVLDHPVRGATGWLDTGRTVLGEPYITRADALKRLAALGYRKVESAIRREAAAEGAQTQRPAGDTARTPEAPDARTTPPHNPNATPGS